MPEELSWLEIGIVWIGAPSGLLQGRHGEKSLPRDVAGTERDEPDD
jgi:hypothetical protein